MFIAFTGKGCPEVVGIIFGGRFEEDVGTYAPYGEEV